MRELVMIFCSWVVIMLVYKGCNKERVAYDEQYRELSSAYNKKSAYYDVQFLLSDKFIHEETDLAQRIYDRIQELHNIQQNKIDSLNKIIENGN